MEDSSEKERVCIYIYIVLLLLLWYYGCVKVVLYSLSSNVGEGQQLDDLTV
jgi:hypothetical protein